MKYCPHCHVAINNERKKCPLCYKILEDDNKSMNYQPYPKKKIKEKMSLVTKILLFVSIVAIIASIIVNIYTIDSENPLYWCVLVAIGVPYIWLSVRYVILYHGNIPTKIFSESLSTIAMVILVELCVCLVSRVNREAMWSLNYALPSLLMATSIGMFVLATIKNKFYCDSIMYLLFLSILEGLYFLFYQLGLFFYVKWMALATLGTGIIILIAMLVFHFKDTTEEFKKRFHL